MFLQHISAKNRRPSEPLLSAPPAWLWSRSRDDERWPERSMGNLWQVPGMTLWTLRLRRFSAYKINIIYMYILQYIAIPWVDETYEGKQAYHLSFKWWTSRHTQSQSVPLTQRVLVTLVKDFPPFFIWDFIGLGWGPLGVLAYIKLHHDCFMVRFWVPSPTWGIRGCPCFFHYVKSISICIFIYIYTSPTIPHISGDIPYIIGNYKPFTKSGARTPK